MGYFVYFGILFIYGVIWLFLEDERIEHPIFQDPRKSTVLQLLVQVIFIPFYIVILPWVILIITWFILHGVYVHNKSVRKIRDNIAKFLNKKPLEFLLDYEISIRRRDDNGRSK